MPIENLPKNTRQRFTPPSRFREKSWRKASVSNRILKFGYIFGCFNTCYASLILFLRI